MPRMRFAGLVLAMVLVLTLVPAAVAEGGTVYTVKPGDSLVDIAAAHGTTASAIVRANELADSDVIRIGQKLTIPAGTAPSTASTGRTPATKAEAAPVVPVRVTGVQYTVKAGDTVNLIAARFGVTASGIVRTNGLNSADQIYSGMQLFIPGATGGGSSATSATTSKPKAAPSIQPTRFVASLSQQHCWLYVNNELIGSWVCSTGRKGSPTLPGTFKIKSKIPRAFGATWNFYMPYWLGIYNSGRLENGIHGIPYSAYNGSKSWANKVGTPITFGCVLLADKHAKILYDNAYIGMQVIVQR